MVGNSAAATIEGLALTSENYRTAIQLLEQRFRVKQVVINSHMDSLLKLQPVHSSTDTKGLRCLYDQIEAHVRGLKTLDVPDTAYGTFLLPILVSKIPDELRILLSRNMTDDSWELNTLLKNFCEELENRERCEGIQTLSFCSKQQRQRLVLRTKGCQQKRELSLIWEVK